MLDALQQILKVADEIFKAGDLEGIMLAYESEIEGFTLWDLNSPEKMQHFWTNFNRMALCMLTPSNLIQLKDPELMKSIAQNWHFYIENMSFPPCKIDILALAGNAIKSVKP